MIGGSEKTWEDKLDQTSRVQRLSEYAHRGESSAEARGVSCYPPLFDADRRGEHNSDSRAGQDGQTMPFRPPRGNCDGDNHSNDDENGLTCEGLDAGHRPVSHKFCAPSHWTRARLTDLFLGRLVRQGQGRCFSTGYSLDPDG
jgi:hypothetical protein